MLAAILAFASCWLLAPAAVTATDHVVMRRDGRQETIVGEVMVEAQDGGLLVIDQARELWTVMPDELVEHQHTEAPFLPHDHDAMSRRLLEKMPGFRIHRTAHYVICYNTSPAYAKWCGSLFERLYRAFLNYWRERDFDVEEPEWPLVALVFGSRAAYAAHAEDELGPAKDSIIGFYSLATNQVTTYDLTGADGQVLSSRSAQNRINAILSRPQAERTVATIIHEATHQLAFNCGLQTRYADIPLWVSEGQAIYFESPDLGSKRGWRNIGAVNQVRNNGFRKYLRTRPRDSLRTLITSDTRFKGLAAPDAYAEAWALNYFLIRNRSKEYAQYIRLLSEKKPMIYDSPEERLQLFCQVFGADLDALDKQFLRSMRSIVRR
jgi:hypothetical protein